MNFELSSDEQALQDTARKFANEVMRPKSAHYDEIGEIPIDIIKQGWELGLMNMTIPAGVRRARPVAPVAGPGGRGARLGLRRHRHLDDRQRPGAAADRASAAPRSRRSASLAPFTESSSSASFGLTEPGAGTDVAGMTTTAREGRRPLRGQRPEAVDHQRRASPSSSRSSARSTGRRSTRASPASWWRAGPRASPSAGTRTRWASAPRTPSRSPSKTCGCRSPTASAHEGEGFDDRHGDARQLAPPHRDVRRRHRPRRLRARRRVREDRASSSASRSPSSRRFSS